MQMTDEQRRSFSVIGTLPEPRGYAVAKFSRSARPYQDWISELTQEGASRFYEQFYFDYGHASIADLAHLTMVAENVSIVAAIELLDEQLVDAQESSTRYQDFTKRTFYTPPEVRDSPLAARARAALDAFLATHDDAESSALAETVRAATLDGAAAAPTLVRYTGAREYLTRTYQLFAETVRPLVKGIVPDRERGAALAPP